MGRKLAYGDQAFLRIITPLWYVLRSRIVEVDSPVTQRHQQRKAAHQRFRQGRSALFLFRARIGRVPFEYDSAMPCDEQRPSVVFRKCSSQRLHLARLESSAFRSGHRPLSGRNEWQSCCQDDNEE